jgi:hypothetical protein
MKNLFRWLALILFVLVISYFGALILYYALRQLAY